MNDIAIRVEKLGKRYAIGAGPRHDTLRDAIAAHLRRSDSQSVMRNPQSDELWALRDVSFEVKRGEVVGVIGRNGAGKSTLLKILSRITEPTTGYAEISGRVGSLLEVGTGFHPELTGRENIFLNGAILGMHRHEIAERFDEIVAFSEIRRFLDTPVKRYSSGMYVRLAFAVAAHLDSDILLVDEVLAVGDAAFQRKCLGMMDSVAKKGRTVVLVSHNMAAILSLCSRAIVIREGTKQFDGPCEQAVSEYLQADEPQKSGGALDLHQVPRTPHQQSLITGLHLIDSALRATKTQLGIGEPICLQIELSLPQPLQNPVMGIGINNHLGARITTVTTRLQSVQLPRLGGNPIIECRIDDLRLAPGVYGMKLAIGNGNEDLDSVELHSVFTVLESDFWGGGKMPNSSQGSVLARAQWTVNS